MNREKLKELLKLHKLWLKGNKGGKRIDLRNADLVGVGLFRANLIGANLSGVNLIGANLIESNLNGANLSGANLSEADLSGTNLSRANLIGADLSDAKLFGADLSRANLSGANLSGANLELANLTGTNLSGAKIISQIDYLTNKFEKDELGYIVYKSVNDIYYVPANWTIKKGSIITETVNFNRTESCGCGINVATLDWVLKYTKREIWKCRIRYEWLAGVCVPYNTDGKIRAEKVELIEIIDREEVEK